MKICPKCKKEYNDDANYCMICGTLLEEKEINLIDSSTNQAYSKNENVKRKRESQDPFPTVKFGKYEWLVLDRVDDKCLLLMKDLLEERKYNNNPEKVGLTWKNSSIRRWLNQTFIKQFSEQEMERVSITQNRTMRLFNGR